MERRVYSGHIFEGSYKSDNPCVVCGTWEDEAFTLPGQCNQTNPDKDYVEHERYITGYYEGIDGAL